MLEDSEKMVCVLKKCCLRLWTCLGDVTVAGLGSFTGRSQVGRR
jgi:hypothetical protein